MTLLIQQDFYVFWDLCGEKIHFLKDVRVKNELYRFGVDAKSPLPQPDSRLNRFPFSPPWTQSDAGGCYLPSIGTFRVQYITSLDSIRLFI